MSDQFTYNPNVTSVHDWAASSLLTVAPQPATDHVSVSLPHWTSRTLEAYSLSGAMLAAITLPDDQTSFKIETGTWATGSYIVRVMSPQGTASAAVVKQ
jgi:hypothetical protein